MTIRSKYKKILQYIQTFSLTRKLPSNILILVTVPRSGSTWLSDTLRCHPSINYNQRNTVFKKFEINGRRYPWDLSNSDDANYLIEVTPYVWDKIPKFDLSLSSEIDVGSVFGECAIEKIHPEYYRYDESGFVHEIKNLEKSFVRVNVIYQVRDPSSVILSWLRYQSRNPGFNAEINGQILADYMKKSYRSIYEMIQLKDGLVVDYLDIKNKQTEVLNSIYTMIWPKEQSDQTLLLDDINEKSIIATSRSTRLKMGSPFLGKKEGSGNDPEELFDDFFASNKHEIECCYDFYNKILALSSLS